MVLATAAVAQVQLVPPEPQTQQTQPQASAPTEQQAPGYRPGFIDAFGRWIGDSVNNWNNTVKDATGAAQDAADTAGNVARGAANVAGTVTRDTAGAVARIPGTRVISERATCPVAPNGAPDCRAAAETICRAHGFASGSSIDFQTAEKCPPIALNRPNGEPPPACVMESYVTRALCQ